MVFQHRHVGTSAEGREACRKDSDGESLAEVSCDQLCISPRGVLLKTRTRGVHEAIEYVVLLSLVRYAGTKVKRYFSSVQNVRL